MVITTGRYLRFKFRLQCTVECFIFLRFLNFNRFKVVTYGILDQDAGGKLFSVMTSF